MKIPVQTKKLKKIIFLTKILIIFYDKHKNNIAVHSYISMQAEDRGSRHVEIYHWAGGDAVFTEKSASVGTTL